MNHKKGHEETCLSFIIRICYSFTPIIGHAYGEKSLEKSYLGVAPCPAMVDRRDSEALRLGVI